MALVAVIGLILTISHGSDKLKGIEKKVDEAIQKSDQASTNSRNLGSALYSMIDSFDDHVRTTTPCCGRCGSTQKIIGLRLFGIVAENLCRECQEEFDQFWGRTAQMLKLRILKLKGHQLSKEYGTDRITIDETAIGEHLREDEIFGSTLLQLIKKWMKTSKGTTLDIIPIGQRKDADEVMTALLAKPNSDECSATAVGVGE